MFFNDSLSSVNTNHLIGFVAMLRMAVADRQPTILDCLNAVCFSLAGITNLLYWIFFSGLAWSLCIYARRMNSDYSDLLCKRVAQMLQLVNSVHKQGVCGYSLSKQ